MRGHRGGRGRRRRRRVREGQGDVRRQLGTMRWIHAGSGLVHSGRDHRLRGRYGRSVREPDAALVARSGKPGYDPRGVLALRRGRRLDDGHRSHVRGRKPAAPGLVMRRHGGRCRAALGVQPQCLRCDGRPYGNAEKARRKPVEHRNRDGLRGGAHPEERRRLRYRRAAGRRLLRQGAKRRGHGVRFGGQQP